jgi:hypothetical protein
MIDWVNVALNALWIFGLAIILAAFSYHHWLAAETSSRLRDVLSSRSWQIPFATGMLLACIGFGYGIADRRWERALWTALALAFAYQLVVALRQPRRNAG